MTAHDGWAPLSLCEARHAECKAKSFNHGDRITALEYSDRQTEVRLRRGSGTMAALQEATKPMGAAKVALLVGPGVISIIGIVASLAWSASKYPTAEDVRSIVNRDAPYLQDRPAVMRVVQGYDIEVKSLRTMFDEVRFEQVKINTKLDQLIEYTKGKKR